MFYNIFIVWINDRDMNIIKKFFKWYAQNSAKNATIYMLPTGMLPYGIGR